MALCETSSLDLNSSEESLRHVETEAVPAAIKAPLQGSQRLSKYPTELKLRTHWRCWDAKKLCLMLTSVLNGPSNFFTTLVSEKKIGFCEPSGSYIN